MNTSRGFMLPFLLILLLVTIGVAVAWWIQEQQSATTTPTGQAGQSTTNKDLLVGPTAGTAPLRVTFALRRDVGTIEIINYGDGSSGTVTDFICGLQYCTRVHTYDRAGTYTAAAEDGSGTVLHSFTLTVTRSP